MKNIEREAGVAARVSFILKIIKIFFFLGIFIINWDSKPLKSVHAQDKLNSTKNEPRKVSLDKNKEKNVEVVLGIDKVQSLNFTPSTKVQVGNESILTYQIIPQKREITFKGVKPGKTSVILRNTLGDIKGRFLITITANDQAKVVAELKDYLKDIEGLEIGIKGDRVYLGGKIVVPGDIGLINALLKKYPDVLYLVELSPQSQRIVAKKMQDEIQRSGLPDVTVRIVNKLYWLEGIVTSKAEYKRAESIALAYVPDRILTLAEREDSVQKAVKPIIQNFITINEKKRPKPTPKLVKITSQFVELAKNYKNNFGLKWTPLIGGTGGQINFGKSSSGGVTTQSSGTLSGTISNLFPKLESAKQAGYARIIQSGVLVIKDKVEGRIEKNSTDRFAIGNTEFIKSETATAGFDLKVTPTVLEKENIELRIGLSVSSNTGNPPQTAANKLSTTLIVKSKESAVVGGVVINKSSSDFDKAPQDDLGEGFSPLFTFLRSKNYDVAKSQFVVFVTPEIIDSATSGTEEIKKKFRRRGR